MQLDDEQRGLLARVEQAGTPSDYARGALDALRRATDDPQEVERVDRQIARYEQKKGART